jgi:hypothetical protein
MQRLRGSKDFEEVKTSKIISIIITYDTDMKNFRHPDCINKQIKFVLAMATLIISIHFSFQDSFYEYYMKITEHLIKSYTK